VLRAPSNLGFAGGNNLALRDVATPFVVLVNNDARPEPEFLERVLAPFDDSAASRVAAVTAKVLFARADPVLGPVINSTGNLVGRDGRGHDRSFGRPDGGPPDDREVFGFYGGAAALRMAALDEAGLFDDDLFLYFEDTDLSWRLRAHGWEVWYEPAAVVHHLYAASSGRASQLSVYQMARNMLIVFTRHAPAAMAARVVLRFLVELPLRLAADLPRLAPTGARLRAFGGYARRVPRLLGERRRLWSQAPVARTDVAAGLEPARSLWSLVRERGRRTGGSAAPSRR
jgi:GT2 family glycosyltransferase